MVVKSTVAAAVRLRIRSVASWLSLAVGIVVTGAAAGAVIDGTPADGLDEIVVTAQRRSENLEKVAVAVSVLRSEDLVNKQIETEEDLQSAVPGLTVCHRPAYRSQGVIGI
jgi:iron complex outermembrane receptor protein